ncbi:hypothetical protein ACH5RR_029276 [Cinchona calisaya]|uniref:RNase H type-1 domain-containing protein n=1 Tax=Cinchona calisaya TaxID=153742 RepID=A0ABD2YV28_9GENT
MFEGSSKDPLSLTSFVSQYLLEFSDARTSPDWRVVRDGNGPFVAKAASRFDNVGSPEHAEMMPARMAVQLGAELQLKGFALEGNAQAVINAIQSDEYSLFFLGPLVENMRILLSHLCVIDFSWVRRSRNAAAHEAARLGHVSSERGVWLAEPPLSPKIYSQF